jgi:U32 family peptidase
MMPLEQQMGLKRSPQSPQPPELLAPAGDWACAKAAVENGADAIYFGLEQFNARMRAENFTAADLPKLINFLHQRGVKGYVTLNTLIFTAELAAAEQYLRAIIAAGVDAAIVQDVGLCRLIRHLSPDFPIHASTQMTITSAAGVEFARDLGCQLVVLARESSFKDIHKIQQQLGAQGTNIPLEVFVHGALCVAYSGQCLTSEALGGRSANRGECAQACRMPYELIVDGKSLDLGDRQYLLSPQDLAGWEILPELVKTGVSCLKIEGRLKAPEYVANVTRVYRQALDRLFANAQNAQNLGTQSSIVQNPAEDRYSLEMSFSRGLHTGWFQGINNQQLVHAQFAKKRGVYLGQVSRISKTEVTVKLQAPLKPGDGIVFDPKHPDRRETGGRVYTVQNQGQETILTFGHRDIDLRTIRVGDRLWKTSDPDLERRVQQSYASETPQFRRPVDLEVYGEMGQPLRVVASDRHQGHQTQVESQMPLITARDRPLTTQSLQEQLGRLGNTPFCLGTLISNLQGDLMLPVSELNRLRREFVEQLESARTQPQQWQLQPQHSYQDLMPQVADLQTLDLEDDTQRSPAELIVLIRSLNHLEPVLNAGIQTLYCEFEDPRRYPEAIALTRQLQPQAQIWVAPPRITKPGESWILEQVKACQADGYLVRNYDHLKFLECGSSQPCIGDFSLNVANPITASHFKALGLQRLTTSYDLDMQQLTALLQACPAQWFEVTIHQHMPMFHMEHCVFCAFLSPGKDYRDCGRPCEQHDVKLRLHPDYPGKSHGNIEHVLQADAGCRNTVFNGTAQTGAEYVQQLRRSGVRYFRIEFINESISQVEQTLLAYQQLLRGDISGTQLWQKLKLQNQLGVTRGSLEKRTNPMPKARGSRSVYS